MSVNINPDYNKSDIREITDPDRFFRTLTPVTYNYVGACPCQKRHISLVPSISAFMQRAETGHVSLNGEDGIRIIRHDDPYMRVSEAELISVLWAKVKQLSKRVEALEASQPVS